MLALVLLTLATSSDPEPPYDIHDVFEAVPRSGETDLPVNTRLFLGPGVASSLFQIERLAEDDQPVLLWEEGQRLAYGQSVELDVGLRREVTVRAHGWAEDADADDYVDTVLGLSDVEDLDPPTVEGSLRLEGVRNRERDGALCAPVVGTCPPPTTWHSFRVIVPPAADASRLAYYGVVVFDEGSTAGAVGGGRTFAAPKERASGDDVSIYTEVFYPAGTTERLQVRVTVSDIAGNITTYDPLFVDVADLLAEDPLGACACARPATSPAWGLAVLVPLFFCTRRRQTGA